MTEIKSILLTKEAWMSSCLAWRNFRVVLPSQVKEEREESSLSSTRKAKPSCRSVFQPVNLLTW